jgi:signal peptidase
VADCKTQASRKTPAGSGPISDGAALAFPKRGHRRDEASSCQPNASPGFLDEEAPLSGRSLPVSPAAVGVREGKVGVWPRRLLNAGGYLVLALALALLASLLTVTATNMLGYNSYVIYSGSMEPAVKVGSLLLTRPVNVEDLQVGDVITYRSPGNHTMLTHRIVDMRQEDGEWVFQTKGDASPGPDPQEVILHGQATKMAFDIPYLGYVVDFAKSIQGVVLLLLVPAAGLTAMQAQKIWRGRALRGVQ